MKLSEAMRKGATMLEPTQGSWVLVCDGKLKGGCAWTMAYVGTHGLPETGLDSIEEFVQEWAGRVSEELAYEKEFYADEFRERIIGLFDRDENALTAEEIADELEKDGY